MYMCRSLNEALATLDQYEVFDLGRDAQLINLIQGIKVWYTNETDCMAAQVAYDSHQMDNPLGDISLNFSAFDDICVRRLGDGSTEPYNIFFAEMADPAVAEGVPGACFEAGNTADDKRAEIDQLEMTVSLEMQAQERRVMRFYNLFCVSIIFICRHRCGAVSESK